MQDVAIQTAPQPKKRVARLRDSESDALILLIGLGAKPEFLRDFCTRLILRHRGDPAKHAIDQSLGWVIEIPQREIDKAVRDFLNGKTSEVTPESSASAK